MAVREYIGARYVPIFGRIDETSVEWDNTKPYEPLTVVLYQGASYTSRQYVPVGVPITNEEFWALTGNYNAQVEAYRQEVRTFDDRITANADAIAQNSDAILENANDIAAEAAARVAADDAETQARTQAIAAETQAREQAITTLTNGLNSERTAREQADTALTNSIAAETQARENAVNALNAMFPVTFENIANQTIQRGNISPDVLRLHGSAQKGWPKAYINADTGDDSTAVVNDSSKPFKTLQAAMDELVVISNNFDFVFQTTGDFYISERFFVGSVIHFRCPSDKTGRVRINFNGTDGGIFFYDSHVNFDGKENCRLEINATGRIFEQEGSTFWTNHTDFICNYIQLIQGSAYFYNCTVQGYITAWFAMVRIYGVEIRNTSAASALRCSTGILRFEGSGITIRRNSNGGTQPAIYCETCHVSTTANMLGESNIGYTRYMDVRGSTAAVADAYIDTMNSYGAANNCQFTSLTLRIKATSVYPTD